MMKQIPRLPAGLRFANCVTAVVFLLTSFQPCVAGSPWQQPVRRTSQDRDVDLVGALVRADRFDDAIKICTMRSRGADPLGDEAAQWAVQRSRILAARQMGKDQFDESDVIAAQSPVAELRESYPEHRRKLFLEAQLVTVKRDAALHSVLRAAVSPGNDQRQQLALERLVRAATEIEELADEVGQRQSLIAGNREKLDLAMIEDLRRLQQELQVDVVSLALMQTELFPRGTRDCIAAAIKAEQAADDAIARLPDQSGARREVERLRVEAILRAEQYDRAEAALIDLVEASGPPTPPRVQSLQVRVDLAQDRLVKAGAQLNRYYGDNPETAPPSLDMDLARLEFLLGSNSGGGIGTWLEAIQRRGGDYARRRAEAKSLAFLRRDDAPDKRPPIDPSIVAAQGRQWLRRGEPGRAGDLLAAAAAAESDPNRAITRASQAAAALVSAGRQADAAEVLMDVSLAKPTATSAAAAHLQSAVLLASSDDADIAERVESVLRTNLVQWPEGESSAAARKWLINMLRSQSRYAEAAVVATRIPTDQVNEEIMASIIANWRDAFAAVEPELLAELDDQCEAAFQPMRERQATVGAYRLAAALMIEPQRLPDLPSADGNGFHAEFIDALIGLRTKGAVDPALGDPTDEYVSDATWRLMRDGRDDPAMRKTISAVLQGWEGNSAPSLDQAERLLWADRPGQAMEMLDQLVARSPQDAEVTIRAARLLGSSDDPKARDRSVQLWDQLAAGTAKGSQQWHQAKLAAIELLWKIGRQSESQRRASYVLLTHQKIDPEYKRRYENFIP